MICKKTYKNQITIPKKVIKPFENVEYFEIEGKDNMIILRPVRMSSGKDLTMEHIKKKLKSLNITEEEIDKAIQWARKK